MMRDLSSVIEELHAAVGAVPAAGQGVRIVGLEMMLPMDLQPVFKDGGCTMLADVARTRAEAAWRQGRSQMRVVWRLLPTALVESP